MLPDRTARGSELDAANAGRTTPGTTPADRAARPASGATPGRAMTEQPPHHRPQHWFGEHPRRGGWRALRRRDGAGDGRGPLVAPEAVPAPFSWQHDRSLWILDWEPDGWVLAELRFDAVACRYAEVRRASYRWPREAAGSLLGRALAAGAVEAVALAARLDAWLDAEPTLPR